MDNEEAEKARKKTQKKSQKKEKKKAKKKKEPKPKKAKPPKPKKEKKPKEADPYPVRKLGFKKVLPVVLLGASVGAVIFIFVNLFADYGTKQTARTAFDSGDYQTCYTYLHGKKRSEAEEQMYQKSQCILHIRMWYREYEMLAADGNELQALDNLIQSVSDYPALFAYALQWEAESEVSQIYNAILDILEGKYGVTEQQAREIAALKSDIAYTREVIAALEAAGYGDGSISADGLQKPGSAGSSEEQPENPADAGSSEGQPENPGDGGGLEGLPGETGDFDGMQTGADGNEGEPGDADDAAGQPDELPEEEEMESEEYVDNQ